MKLGGVKVPLLLDIHIHRNIVTDRYVLLVK